MSKLKKQLRELVVKTVPALNQQEVLDVTNGLRNMVDDWLSASAEYRNNVLTIYRAVSGTKEVRTRDRDLKTLLKNFRNVKVVFDSRLAARLGEANKQLISKEQKFSAFRENPKTRNKRSTRQQS